MKTFAVTGEIHGSIVEAESDDEAKEIFRKHYPGEVIWIVKDISNYNLENL